MTSTNTSTQPFQGRVAVVTGGSGGIGRAVVERLARDGYDLVVHYAGNQERAQDALRAATDAGARALAHPGDVADEQDMAALFSAAEEAFGGVDVVVHTAGVMLLGPVLDYSLDDFDRMHRTNVRGPSSSRSSPPAGSGRVDLSSPSRPRSPGCRCRPTRRTSRPRRRSRA